MVPVFCTSASIAWLIVASLWMFIIKTFNDRCQSTSTDEPRTKRNLLDNASNLLTNLLSGGSLGSMPIAEGAVTDLFGKPFFFSLYDWFLEVCMQIVEVLHRLSYFLLVNKADGWHPINLWRSDKDIESNYQASWEFTITCCCLPVFINV